MKSQSAGRHPRSSICKWSAGFGSHRFDATFPLTTSQLPKYEITFQGKQPLDELSTYIFAVKPRALDRAHAYFSGVVWVDEQDMVIVKTMGKWVTETGDVTSPMLPFAVFETYRQQVGKNLWFFVFAVRRNHAGRQDHAPDPRDHSLDRLHARRHATRVPAGRREALRQISGGINASLVRKSHGEGWICVVLSACRFESRCGGW